jgi:xeroderma pigmentosum group C-complementing protein
MLAEAEAQSSTEDDGPPVKKRRVTPQTDSKQELKPANRPGKYDSGIAKGHAQNLQTVEDSSESESSEFEFEDVNIESAAEPSGTPEPDGIEDVAISLGPDSTPKRHGQTHRRKPATFAEKAHRLMVHKLHVLCLLGHNTHLNGWCNNAVVKRHLRPLLTAKTISYLNPKAEFSQFQRNRSFVDGLQQAIDAFTAEYRVTARGLKKPRWIIEDEPDIVGESPEPMDRSDFIQAAKNMEGSQDTGNQLFCALLRAVGVQARLVCSLQPLPFGSVPKAVTPRKPVKLRVYPNTSDTNQSASDGEDSSVNGSSVVGKIPSVRRRLGQPTFAAKPAPTPLKKREKPIQKLSYPVYWVEAFNEAQQKWLPVDPIVTHTVNKAFKLEPPTSYDLNQLTYAIAFEGSGAARDVTKRYAKAYNAKTRRFRVESSHEGARWFRKAMRIFRRRTGPLDRDQVEDAELAQKEAREGMPANVLDFKDHPYYALERHLKRNEVIHPKREVGKVNAGTAAKPRMEAVYRRQDILSCKSADKWYRCGREVKEGEQPLKHVTARSRRQRSVDDEDLADGGPANTTALYGPYQTRLYVPPPVERGRIPKNAYGNLDIYVPSMVPPGGAHIRHRLAKDAARLLRVDFADAVTGFQFKGRHGTAIVEGVVVAQQFADAVQAVIDGFEDAQAEEESRSRSLAALRQWKRFLVGLRIAERVSAYGDGSKSDDHEIDDVHGDEEMEDTDIQPGGFFPGAAEEDVLPTAGRFSVGELNVKPKAKRKLIKDDSEDDTSLVVDDELMSTHYNPDGRHAMKDDPDQGEGFFADHTEEEDEPGGGFLPDATGSTHDEGANDEYDQGGGFLVDEDQEGTAAGFLSDTFDDREEADDQAEPRGESTSARSPLFADRTVDANQLLAKNTAEQPTREAKKEEAGPGTGNNSEADSLPSRDPDDDGLEPDWLESD